MNSDKSNMQEKRLGIGMGSTNESDFRKLTTTIKTRLKESPQYSKRRCIYRVPNDLRRVNEQAYTPLLVSIGPLHHNDDKLLPMEAHKLKYLQSFLQEDKDEVLLNSCVGIVKTHKTEIRECYADPIDLSSDDFAQMVLIDSVFIIQLFRITTDDHPRGDDYVHDKPFLLHRLKRDIKLAENQLPFFILDRLYRAALETHTSRSNSAVSSFTEIACKFLDQGNTSDNYFHLLHLEAQHFKPGGNHGEEVDIITIEVKAFPAATSLHEAGVKFEVIEDSSSMFDIEFDPKKGILKMPQLVVDDNTEDSHRNLIAFEQCHYGMGETRYFTDYHIFLNSLINTPEDVHLLAEAGIIENCMGSPNQVSDLINSMDSNTCPSHEGYYYLDIARQLRKHCKRRWNRHRATLMHNYFNHPWAAISVVYATVLLLLTIIQVVTGIMQSTQK